MRNDLTGHTPAEGSRLATSLILIGIVLSTLAVYAQLRHYSFVNFDDDVHVYENPHVNSGLSWENARWAFGIHGPSQWHPLAWLSHQLDVELFGLQPRGHHLSSLFFHTATAVLLFLALTHATGELWPSACVATIFALHPLNVESVAWISERRNVLSMFFGVLTVLAYSWYTRTGGWRRYALVVIVFALGLMAKPQLVTLPFVLLLLDYWPLRRLACARNDVAVSASAPRSGNYLREGPSCGLLVLEKLPLLTLSLASGLLTIWCQQSAAAVASTEKLPIVVRLMNMLSVYGIYIRKVFWPFDLAVFYPHPGLVHSQPLTVLFVPALVGGLTLIVITAWSLVTLRRHPYLAVGWFWYLGTLLPMVGLVQVGQQQMADRYMYLPLIGLLIALVWIVRAIVPVLVKQRHILWYLAVPAAAGCMVISWKQTSYWQDSVTLFRRATAVTERNSWAYNNLGLALHQRGISIEAIAKLEEALRIDPDYVLARYNLGVVWQDVGRTDRSIREFQEAVRLNPAYVDAHLRLGTALADFNQLGDAVHHFEQAVKLAPENPSAHLNLGIALGRQAKTRQAIVQFRQVLALEPDNVKAHFGLSTGLNSLGESREAEEHLRRVIALAPGFAPAYNELGKLLLRRGKREQAIQRFRQALQCDPNHVEAQALLQQILQQR
jgi:tetratricopeptide (TPR) repeat protein